MSIRMIRSDSRYSISELMSVWSDLKKKKPLVYQLSNMVAASLQANVCLASGASSVMSLCRDEAGIFAAQADSILMNVGTPTSESLMAAEAVLVALSQTPEHKALILDPVGYGATDVRRDFVHRILESGHVSIVKGNSGEMCLLGGEKGVVRGIDGAAQGDVKKALSRISEQYNVVAVATGEIDVIVYGENTFSVKGGSHWLPEITGSGCSVGTIIAGCAAVTQDPLLASLTGLIAVSIASERAEKVEWVRGPGSFGCAFIDEIYRLSPPDFFNAESRWEERKERCL